MEVILKEDVAKLGHKDDIVTVKNGYGRNYLIPQGIAALATPSAKKVLAENLKQRAHKLEKIKQDAVELAAKMDGLSLTIGAKASSTGKIVSGVKEDEHKCINCGNCKNHCPAGNVEIRKKLY